jgi:hypothetical protein
MHKVEAERKTELLANEVSRRADPATRSVGVSPGMGLDQRGEVLDGPCWHRRVDREHNARGDRKRERVEVLVGVIRGFAVKGGIDGEVRAGNQNGVAVRLRLRRSGNTDVAVGTADVLDIELSCEFLGQLLGDQAGNHVRRTAGRKGSDHPHRSRRISLRPYDT